MISDSMYRRAVRTLRAEKGKFRLANLMAHGYEIGVIFDRVYVTLHKDNKEVVILHTGDHYTRCLG